MEFYFVLDPAWVSRSFSGGSEGDRIINIWVQVALSSLSIAHAQTGHMAVIRFS